MDASTLLSQIKSLDPVAVNSRLTAPEVQGQTQTSTPSLGPLFSLLGGGGGLAGSAAGMGPSQKPALMGTPIKAKVTKLEALVNVLKGRVSGEQIMVGQLSFPSFNKLSTWVAKHMTSNRFGLACDAMLFPDFFFVGAQTVESVVTTFHGSTKNGFNTMFESRVAASTQNLLPVIFGKMAAGADAGVFLPACSTYKKWNAGKGTQGLYYQILSEIPNAQSQFQHAIPIVLGDGSPSAKLCQDLLTATVRVWTALCKFVENFMTRLSGTGGYRENEAWGIVSQCIHQIFADVSTSKASARDIRDAADPCYTCSQYLWTTLKAHKVMTAYMERNFYDILWSCPSLPSISCPIRSGTR